VTFGDVDCVHLGACDHLGGLPTFCVFCWIVACKSRDVFPLFPLSRREAALAFRSRASFESPALGDLSAAVFAGVSPLDFRECPKFALRITTILIEWPIHVARAFLLLSADCRPLIESPRLSWHLNALSNVCARSR